jgi:hypothetical protein
MSFAETIKRHLVEPCETLQIKMQVSRFAQDTLFEILRNFENQNDFSQKRLREIWLKLAKLSKST